MPEQVVTPSDLPASIRSLYDKAAGAVKMKNPGYAIQLLLPVIKELPSFLEGRKLLRMAAISATGGKKKGIGGFSLKIGSKSKDPNATLYEVEEGLQNDPFNLQLNQSLFEAASALGMDQTASFALETIMQGHPTNVKVMHQAAAYFMANDDPERAITVYNNILKVDPTDGEARKGVTNANARLSMKRQKWEGGEGSNFRELLRNKDKAKQMEDMARIGATREQMQEQLAHLAEEYAADQNNVDISRRIADLYERLEDYQNALAYYSWAFQLSNGDSSLEAKVHKMQDKIDELAIRQLKEEIEANPNAPENEERLAEIRRLETARSEKLVVTARERVERNPTDPQLRFELGTHLFNAGHPTEAIPELQRARNNPAIRTKAMILLARCYDAKGMFDMAERTLTDANSELQTMDATRKELLYLLGTVLDKRGKKEESLEAFKQIYEIDYGYLDVAQRVEGSYSAQS